MSPASDKAKRAQLLELSEAESRPDEAFRAHRPLRELEMCHQVPEPNKEWTSGNTTLLNYSLSEIHA